MNGISRFACVMGLLLASTPSGSQTPDDQSLDALLEVRVSAASKLERTTMRSPASVTIVTAEDIERFGYRTLQDVLASVAGLYLTDDRNYGYVGVRGFGRETDYNTRVQILVDGLRLNDDFYGYAPIGTDLPLDPGAVERVEIVRGPSSAAFGSGAMLATINVVLREPLRSSEIEAAVEAGDPGLVGVTAHGAHERSSFGIAWSLASFESDGENLAIPEYLETDGTDQFRRMDWDRGRSATARATFGELDFTALTTKRRKGIPTGAWDTDPGDRRTASGDRYDILAASWEHGLGRGLSLKARGQLGHYDYAGTYVGEGIAYGDATENRWWGLDAQATWEPRPDRRLLAGFEIRDNRHATYESFDELGTSYFDQDFPHRIRALFVEQELQLGERTILTLGVRHDDSSLGGSSTSPRAAVVFLPNADNSVKLLYGRAFRAPNVYERYYEQESDGVKANPEVGPERISNIELVWERRIGRNLFASVSAYRMRITDLIAQIVDPDDGMLFFDNVEENTGEGLELELTARPASGLVAYARGDLRRTRDDSTGEALTNSPGRSLALGLSRPLGAGFHAAGELFAESGRRTLGGTETSSWARIDGTVGWRPAGSPWSLALRVDNLLDSRITHPAGLEHLQAEIVQPGRAISLRLGVQLR